MKGDVFSCRVAFKPFLENKGLRFLPFLLSSVLLQEIVADGFLWYLRK